MQISTSLKWFFKWLNAPPTQLHMHRKCTTTKPTCIFKNVIHGKYEFDHFTDGKNYALFRPASQSSTLGSMEASFAVDDIDQGDISYSHTDGNDYHPWWKVQLDYPICVTHVEITNRLHVGKQVA